MGLTAANATSTPTADFAYGVFLGVSATFDLTGLGGSYTSLTLSDASATAVDPNNGPVALPIDYVAAPAPAAYVTIDFNPATSDGKYSFQVLLNNDQIISVTVDGSGKTAAQMAQAVRTALRANGFGYSPFPHRHIIVVNRSPARRAAGVESAVKRHHLFAQ